MATKSDLIAHLTDTNVITEAQARRLVGQMLDFIADRVAVGETVALKGFGSFELRARKARTGRNPQTGAAMQIPARSTMGFRAAKKAGG